MIGLAAAGDTDAMHAVLVETARLVTPLVRRVAGRDADDVLQRVLWAVARKLSWLDEPRAFRAWVFRIAARAALKHVARERRVWPFAGAEELDELAVGEASPTTLPTGEIESLLEAATPRSRVVLVLRYLEGMSLVEIAAVLNVPVGTVKSRLAYGLRLIREAAGKG